MSILYSPEDYGDKGVEVVINFDVMEPDYSFDILLVVRDKQDGKLYAATDSGCSCPVPFEDHTYPTDYTEVRSWNDLLAVLRDAYPEDGHSAYRSNPIDPLRQEWLRATERPQQPEDREAIYRIDCHVHFLGPIPKQRNGHPEVTNAHREAVEALEETLRNHGFTIARSGHGVLRVGTTDPTIQGHA